MKTDGPFVSFRSKRFDALHSRSPTPFGELLVEPLAHAAPTVIGMDANLMHVSRCRRRRDHHPQKEPNQLAFLFRDEGILAELVEEHRIGTPTGRPSPPLVEHGDDIVEVGFGETPDLHRPGGADITNVTKTHELDRVDAPSADDGARVCPFCHAAFEDREECPEHQLSLVSQSELPRRVDRPSGVSFFADPRHGRGGVLVGAAAVLLGFFLPFVEFRGLLASALVVAIDGAANLWLTPGAALGQLWILWSRRDAGSMRKARLAVLGLALAGALPLTYTRWRIVAMADAASANVGFRMGLWIMVGGLALCAASSVFLGRMRRTRDRRTSG